MDPTEKAIPHSVDSTAFKFNNEEYIIEYSTYVPPIEFGQHQIWSKLEIVSEKNRKVYNQQLYPNFVTTDNLNIAIKTILANPKKYITNEK